jgi:MinD-like ATPase involved in chromosome partitioning or flagellar assembly
MNNIFPSLDNAMEQFESAVVALMPSDKRQSYKAAREHQKAREADALAEKNTECALAIESLAQAIQSKYCRTDLESAMQAVSRAYTAALVVDPKDAA